jgi:hypothetical protein
VFLGIDLANFYLNTPMADPEYMRLRLDIIPEEIIVKYNLRNLVDEEGWVYIEIRKGMYGLPQAGIIARQLLKKRLSEKGYYQCQRTPGLWRHVWRCIVFCLVVDDVGIKVTNMDNIHHLTSALEEHYKVAVDWKGSLFCGVKLTWDYINRHVTTNMPGYIGDALTKYQHPKPAVPQHTPYKATTIHYGAKVQRVEEDKSPPLTTDQSSASKRSWALSSTTGEQSTPLYSPPSARSQQDNPTAPRLSRKHAINSLITLLPTPMPASATMPVT